MKTLLTIKEQNEFLSNNWRVAQISHKWSCRGYGNSRIIDSRGETISKASGCGYDRFGTVIGDYIEATFPNELQRLGKRFCKTKYAGDLKSAKAFYGMTMNKAGKVFLDGACGYNCMYEILNAIGFELVESGRYEKSNNGETFLVLRPVSAHTKKYVLGSIK